VIKIENGKRAHILPYDMIVPNALASNYLLYPFSNSKRNTFEELILYRIGSQKEVPGPET
jgi:hypothetical protein